MMKRKRRKAAAAVIVLLNLLLLGACAWAVSALVRGPAEASSSSPPEGSVSARPEAVSYTHLDPDDPAGWQRPALRI